MSLRAIARQLGVSSTTVSLALKNSPRISPAMTAQVKALAKASGYVPNARLAELMSEVRKAITPSYHATLGVFSLYPQEQPWREAPHLKTLISSGTACAQSHGYQLEYFWYKQPGMTPARFRSILKARGIQGLFCLGSLDPEERFPEPLRDLAIVTFASSIPSTLHRVASHCMADAQTLFDQILQRGYKRPGLCILVHGDRRTSYAYSATYSGVLDRLLPECHLPILRTDSWDVAAFESWFTAHRPDAIVLHQDPPFTNSVERYLRQVGLRVPEDVGIALLDKNPDRARYAGISQDIDLMGTAAIELLIGRLVLRDLSVPMHPKIELVVGEWNEGTTLRPLPVKGLRTQRQS